MKINKVFPPFYGGISEQNEVLVLDNQVRDMENFVPSLLNGAVKRAGITDVASLSGVESANGIFHSYSRGLTDNKYMFTLTASNTLKIYKVSVNGTATLLTTISDSYLGSDISKLRALTVQDTTYITNTDKVVGQSTVTAPSYNYDSFAFYWLKRSSNDTNNPYTYACYINGYTFSYADKDSTVAATNIANQINASVPLANVVKAEARGSIVLIYPVLNPYQITSFSTWDSWGNQASKGWMGNVRRITELPDVMPNFTYNPTIYVKIGQSTDTSTTSYYVKWNGSSWEECVDPHNTRGLININTPYKIAINDSTGAVTVSKLSLYAPKVGDADTNPNPSFVGQTIQDILFFKNRLGFCSQDNVILSETGNYDNFYATSILDILETDTIDVSIAGNTASKIYYAVPFQRGLYIFTQDAQFELLGEGGSFTPTTVSIVPVSSYTIDINVKPVVSGTSLYFISSNGSSVNQLREFVINNDTLVADGIDLTLTVPSLIPQIKQIAVSTLNNTILLIPTTGNIMYCYKFSEDGKERVQSSWTKLKYPQMSNIKYVHINEDEMYIVSTSSSNNSVLSKTSLNLDKDTLSVLYDTYLGTQADISASLTIPKWIPKLGNIKNTANKLIIKSISGSSEGSPYVSLYYKRYNITKEQSGDRLKDMKASILAPSTDVDISIKHSAREYCAINNITLEGLYKISSREMA